MRTIDKKLNFISIFPPPGHAAGLNPSVPPKDGIFISGLRLYNALWDTARGLIMSGASDKKSCQDMPVVWLKPYDISLFLSPLYCSADQRCHSHATILTELPLPTFVDPAAKQSISCNHNLNLKI